MLWFGPAFGDKQFFTDEDEPSLLDDEIIYKIAVDLLKARNHHYNTHMTQIGRYFPNCIHVYDLSTEKWGFIGFRK